METVTAMEMETELATQPATTSQSSAELATISPAHQASSVAMQNVNLSTQNVSG